MSDQKIPKIISKDSSTTKRYSNSINAIASRLVAMNGSKPKMTKYPFMHASRKTTPRNNLLICIMNFDSFHTSPKSLFKLSLFYLRKLLSETVYPNKDTCED